MKLVNRFQFPTLLGALFILIVFSSCEEDLTTIGGEIVGDTPFTTSKEVFNVYAYNNKINAVQTNKLAVYQLGAYNDPVYGRTEGQIVTQMQLASGNPTFGTYSQSSEDGSETDDSVFTIPEEEKVTEVYLYIPYLTKSVQNDTDSDGVPDEFDDVVDEDNDNDGDGVSNLLEAASGTDPLDASSVDANFDGLYDPENTEAIISNNFARQIDLDSIYGDRDTPFKLNVKRSTFYLRDYDPETNFTEAQNYFSDRDYNSFATETISIEEENEIVISDKEILITEEDDESTEDVDESLTFTKLNPGIYLPLDNDFFQENILDKEGSSELLNQNNFEEYLRGLHISLTSNEDLMLLLDLSNASITMTYTYEAYDADNVESPSIETEDYVFSLIGTTFTGNAVNTFISEDYSTEISEAINATEQNAEKIYLKGGSGAYATIKLFDENNSLDVINQIKANNWIINEARLVFYVEEEANQAINAANTYESSIKPPRLYLFNTEDNSALYNSFTEYSTDVTPFGLFLNYNGFLEESSSGDSYSINITEYINSIIEDGTNETLGLMITPNIETTTALNANVNGELLELPIAPTISPLGTVLYGSNVSSENLDKKLQLEIFYTKTN